MTNQLTNNEDRIRKAHLQFLDDLRWNRTGYDFRKAIEDNLPQSISREAVIKLREKRNKIDNEYADTWIWHFVKDLDALLCNQNDD